MKPAWESTQPFVLRLGCWTAGAAVATGIFRAAVAGEGFRPGAKGMAAASAVTLLLSLVIPALSIVCALPGEGAPTEDLRRWGREVGAALAGSALGIAAFALMSSPGAIPSVLASLVVTGAAAVSFGALARALGSITSRLARRPGSRRFGPYMAAGCVAAAALLLLEAAAIWSGAILRGPAGPAFGKWIVGASPFLAAALPWTQGSHVWSYDPRLGALYDIWIGTHVPLAYPSWVSCAAGHLLVGAALLAAAELPRIIRARRRSRPPAAAPPRWLPPRGPPPRESPPRAAAVRMHSPAPWSSIDEREGGPWQEHGPR